MTSSNWCIFAFLVFLSKEWCWDFYGGLLHRTLWDLSDLRLKFSPKTLSWNTKICIRILSFQLWNFKKNWILNKTVTEYLTAKWLWSPSKTRTSHPGQDKPVECSGCALQMRSECHAAAQTHHHTSVFVSTNL